VIPHREIAENPDDPYPDAYCPSNPKSYELLFDVIDEVVDVFEPNVVHIGHDEWYSVALCPACKGKDASDLLSEDVTKIRNYLYSKGISTEMCADKFLDGHSADTRGQGGAFRIVEDYTTSEIYNTMPPTYMAVGKIPKDIMMAHWHWGLEPNGHKIFATHGLDTVIQNFGAGAYVRKWDEISRHPNVHGGILTHWDLVEENNMAWDQFLTYSVDASFLLWNESYNEKNLVRYRDLTFKYMPYFRQILSGIELPSLSQRPKEYVSVLLRHEKHEKYYMSTSFVELRNYFYKEIKHTSRDRYFKGAKLTVIEKGHSFRIAVINDKVDSLLIKHSTSISLPYKTQDNGPRPEDYFIGFYTVKYKDGTTGEIRIDYGKNISNMNINLGVINDPNDCWYSYDAQLMQVAYHCRPEIKTTNQKECITVFQYEWINPEPGKEIVDLTLTLNNMNKAFSISVYDIYGIKFSDSIPATL
jgi:hypothetical protein